MAKIRDDFEGVTFVYDEDSNAVRLQAGDEIPEWATVGKHLTAVDDHAADNLDQDGGADDAQPTEPPREGRGSGKGAWQDYAASLGVPFPKDATRDQIVELVDAATIDTGDDDDPGDGGPDDVDNSDA